MLSHAHLRRACTAVLLACCLLVVPSAPAQTIAKQARAYSKTAGTGVPLAPQTFRWVPAPPMSFKRIDLAAAALGQKIYALGGFQDGLGVPLDTMEAFDPAVNAWAQVANMPTPRKTFAAAALNGKLYVVGGTSNGLDYLSAVDVYDPATDSWAAAPALPTARRALAAAVLNNKLYVLGGFDNNSAWLDTVEVYDPVMNAWSVASPMPTARYSLAAATLNGKLYAIGGRNNGVRATVEVYDPTTDSWAQAAPLPFTRADLAAAVLDGKLYAIGGVGNGLPNGTYAADTVFAYDPVMDSWTQAPSLSVGRSNLAAAVLNNRLYAVGGFNIDSANFRHYFNSVEFLAAGAFPAPGDVLISEFRFSGPAGAQDEFIELYNNTDQPIMIGATDASAGWALVTSNGVVRAALPNGDVLPARGHYLVVNTNGYSLANYPAGTPAGGAAGDRSYASDIPESAGLALFITANPANFQLGNRLDAVGPNNLQNTLYKEGSGYPAIAGGAGLEYSFTRLLTLGRPQDTDNNAADFVYAAADITADIGAGNRLGAPSPENTASPVQRNATVKSSLIDPQQASTAAPNRVRDTTSGGVGTPTAQGTFAIRRKFTNKTGQPITRLRFRIVDMTTYPAPAGIADLRALGGQTGSFMVTLTGGIMATVQRLTLEEPPAQPNGGGLNASLSANTITIATSLAPNASINVEFLLGVAQGGAFRFFVNVEALP